MSSPTHPYPFFPLTVDPCDLQPKSQGAGSILDAMADVGSGTVATPSPTAAATTLPEDERGIGTGATPSPSEGVTPGPSATTPESVGGGSGGTTAPAAETTPSPAGQDGAGAISVTPSPSTFCFFSRVVLCLSVFEKIFVLFSAQVLHSYRIASQTGFPLTHSLPPSALRLYVFEYICLYWCIVSCPNIISLLFPFSPAASLRTLRWVLHGMVFPEYHNLRANVPRLPVSIARARHNASRLRRQTGKLLSV